MHASGCLGLGKVDYKRLSQIPVLHKQNVQDHTNYTYRLHGTVYAEVIPMPCPFDTEPMQTIKNQLRQKIVLRHCLHNFEIQENQSVPNKPFFIIVMSS